MQKNTLVVVVILIVLAIIASGYFYWSKYYQKTELVAPVMEQKIKEIEKVEEAGEVLIESYTKSTLPEINPQSNPLEKLPETNPIEQTNPFKDLKTNPFE